MENKIDEFNELAEMLKVISHPVRLCIVYGLMKQGECNVTNMQNCLNMPQSTVSQHLQKLRTSGIIEGVRNGLEINYKIKDNRVASLVEVLIKD